MGRGEWMATLVGPALMAVLGGTAVGALTASVESPGSIRPDANRQRTIISVRTSTTSASAI